MDRILIYRLGSIGDIVVALPCFNLVRRRFPNAQITLLTNMPVEGRAAPAMSIMNGSGLVDNGITYPLRTRDLKELRFVRSEIRNLRADHLIYLASRRNLIDVYRDYLFFLSCGISNKVGFPFLRELRQCRPLTTMPGLWESEANRLGRCIASLGPVDVDAPASWDMHLTPDETQTAAALLSQSFDASAVGRGLICISVGTKQSIKDWGINNWRAVLAGLARPDIGLVLIGAADEREISEQVSQVWPGPVANYCGMTSPRVSAAVLRKCRIFLGHDSGPMHLAAAVGTTCVALFAGHSLPGQWFPFGRQHKIIRTPEGSPSIQSILPATVIAAALDAFGDSDSVAKVS